MTQRNAFVRAAWWPALLAVAVTVLFSGSLRAGGRPAPATRPRPARAATEPAASTQPADPLALGRLLVGLYDPNATVRRSAAVALGRLDDPEALWPLIQTGAGDPDAKVRQAAVEAVTWLGPDPDSERTRSVREKLLSRTVRRLTFRDIDFKDAIQFFREYSDTSIHVNWRPLQPLGADPDLKINLEMRDATLGEVLCRTLTATGRPVGFLIVHHGNPLYISSIADVTEGVRAMRRYRARIASLRRWGERTAEGRRTLGKLQTSIKAPQFKDTRLDEVIRYLHDLTGVEFVVDWPALKEAGIEPATPIALVWDSRGRKKGEAPVLPTGGSFYRTPSVERGLWGILARASERSADDEIPQYVVDGKIVFISTAAGVDRRMAGRKRLAPRE